MLVPPAPGVFSALGLLFGDTEQEFVTHAPPALRSEIDAGIVDRAFATLERDATAAARATTACIAPDDVPRSSGSPTSAMPARPTSSTVRVPEGPVDAEDFVDAFVAEHARTYGHGSARRSGRPRHATRDRARRACRRRGSYRPAAAAIAHWSQSSEPGTRTSARATGRWRRPVLTRAALLDEERAGPFFVDEYDSTIVVPPGCARPARRVRQHRDCDSVTAPLRAASRSTPSRSRSSRTRSPRSADEMALIVMRSAYSPVVRDTMDYSTALCDRHGRIIAQGLTLAVQLGTFPDGDALRARATATARAGRRLHHERSVRVRRPAPARHLRHQADLRRRRARGVGGDDGAPRGRRRYRSRQHRRPRDGDLPGGPAPAAAQALRRGQSRTRRSSGSSRRTRAMPSRCSATSMRSSPRAVPESAAYVISSSGTARRRVRATSSACRTGRSARCARRSPRSRTARTRSSTSIDGFGDDPEPLRIQVSVAIRGRRDRRSTSRARRRRSKRASTARSAWSIRRLLLRDPRDRPRGHPELRGLHAPDPRARAGGHDRQPGAPRRLRRARRDRLSRLRRDHGRARPGRARARDRRRRRRPDADRFRRLRRRAPAVRA